MTHTLLIALLLSAVISDLMSRRVPNTVVLTGLVLAFIAHTIALCMGSVPLAGRNWWAPLTGLLTGLASLMPLYLLRATGAGDVKLMGMVGAFIGAQSVLTATVYTLLAGGLLSLVFMLGRGVAAQTLANVRFLLTDWALRASSGQGARLAPLQTTAARLPYAVAIALGTGAALLWPLATP
ncbi:prepilin peptidase [Rhodoferax ferrireducens]|uniref:A24 family peptidase n=1 Tax=Rhodoferax ferrireducens TaxID=192843 RepID=UPI00298EAB66|nr:prepilin peptidase [Rhodoferax ferrireducens]WPC67759.1 prepilin peptidase [Rhodoferax ferrireducens]